ncbi:DUF4249 domain-containing protein [Olivibacter sp. SDN3]|uniref:DUF4249 domain-containing protein n=1 Tax=Olivibacter sp. SDN3 TaxID=2764720 RepID=UPI0016518B92|nr:DUF4249 domain-containing protein [Olivibacter sp. SDN3]QNL50835.1 DUF4249 domain-containing protein [Olivibacter sp. SDN3]
MQGKIVYTLLIGLMAISACRKPYDPVIGEESRVGVLVVEGFINLTGVTEVRLSRTGFLDDSVVRHPDRGAIVQIEGENGDLINSLETAPGVYQTDTIALTKEVNYRIRIRDQENEEYLSDFVQLLITPPIEKLTWEEIDAGIDLKVSTDGALTNTSYFRWDFFEDYVFYTPFNSRLIFENDQVRRRNADEQVFRCFRNQRSTNILIGNTHGQSSSLIDDFYLKTIPRGSELLTERYSVLVEQTALSREAYMFWDLIRKNSEDLGDIFGTMPSELITNIQCISNANKQVIGFVEGGKKASKRIYINNNNLSREWVAKENIYGDCTPESVFIDEVNSPLIVFAGGMVPVDEIYSNATSLLIGYTYANPRCVDCTIRGSARPPMFWNENE